MGNDRPGRDEIDVNILGINAYHGDAAACMLVDGKPVAAIEEERIRRLRARLP